MMDLRSLRLVSLSHVNDPERVTLFPGDPPSTLEVAATVAADGYHLQVVCQGEHTGTHWGAPGHFNEGEPLADDLDPGDLLLPAVRVDLRERCRADPDYAVTIDDLVAWEADHGRMPEECAVILHTGWQDYWGTPAFTNQDSAGVIHQPGFAPETVRWLTDTGRLGRRGALGTDTFGPDRGVDRTYAASRLLYRDHRISLEVLAHLEQLPASGAWVMAGGQINRRGSGSPALVLGLVPGDQLG